MLCQWLWIMFCYAVPVVGNHHVNTVPVDINPVLPDWARRLESRSVHMPVGVNHCELYWASGCESRVLCGANVSESLWIVLSYWFSNNVSYTEILVVNHCELCWASGYALLWGMLSQWLWIVVMYADTVVVNHGVLWLASVCVKHVALFWANGWESCCAMLSQWLWIMASHAVPVNHFLVYLTNIFEPW